LEVLQIVIGLKKLLMIWLNRNSLKDIEKCINIGATINISNGFHSRNKKNCRKYTYDLAKRNKKYFKISC